MIRKKQSVGADCFFHALRGTSMQEPIFFYMMSQRWRRRQDSYRPRGEPIDTSRYEVALISDDKTARTFVCEHHYMRSFPSAKFRFGLYERGAQEEGRLVGVAVFSVPQNYNTYNVFKGFNRDRDRDLFCDLGRFILLDRVPANGETWFLGQCFRHLKREGMAGIVSFSDSMPRHIEDRCVFPGHIGAIYQAYNGVYVGRSDPSDMSLFPDGSSFSPRTAQKIRTKEQGWEGSAEQLRRWGADEPWEDTRAWLSYWMRKLTRQVRHPGNHKYCWSMGKAWKLPECCLYPKEYAS